MSLLNKEYVYLLEEIEIDSDKPTGLVKIGRTSNDVEDRINQLKTGNPRKLRRFAIIETEIGQSSIEESKQHLKYGALRAPDGGGVEWFKDDTDIIKPLFKIEADKSTEKYDFYCDQLEDFMNGKYKNTFSFVVDHIYQYIKNKHICVLAPPKSGKRIMVQSVALLMPYAHHYFITALDRKADRHQIQEFDPYGIFAVCLTNSNKENIESIDSMKNDIKKSVSKNEEIVIHFDECDYGSYENGKVGSFIKDLKTEFNNKNVHFIVYSATPEEAIWSDADYHLAHYKPTDDYNGPEWFLTNNLVIDPVPFMNVDSNQKAYLNQQAKELLSDWKTSDKKYIVLRLNYSLKDKFLSRKLDKNGNRIKSRSAFLFARENLRDLIDNHLKDVNVEVEFYDQEDNFDWVFLNKNSKMPGTWFRISDNKKRLIVINGTCTRSTEVGFHPDIFAWHDYRKGGRKASTNYGTYAQAIGRVFHYMPDYKKKERTSIFGLRDTKIKLYVEKDLISVMNAIYSSSSKIEMESIWKQYANKNKSTIRKPGMRIVSVKKDSAIKAKVHIFTDEQDAINKRKSILDLDSLRSEPLLNSKKAKGIPHITRYIRKSGPNFIRRIKEETLPSRHDILIKIDGPPGYPGFVNDYNDYLLLDPSIKGKYVVFEPIENVVSNITTLCSAKTLHNEIV